MSKSMFLAVDIANWFLAKVDREGGDAITDIKIHLMVYYTQAWHLGLYEECLFDEDCVAAPRGPRVPSLLSVYAGRDCPALPGPEKVNKALNEDKRVRILLLDIFESYGRCDATQIEGLVCAEPPWTKARAELAEDDEEAPVISKRRMLNYHKNKYDNSLYLDEYL